MEAMLGPTKTELGTLVPVSKSSVPGPTFIRARPESMEAWLGTSMPMLGSLTPRPGSTEAEPGIPMPMPK